jgi:hypothetical protein
MRKLIFLIAISVTCRTTAAVHTVSSDPNKPAEFTNAAAALAAAATGDTLYIYGSPNGYGDLVINKSITLIGAGYNARKEMFAKSVLGLIDFSAGTVNNVELNGIVCTRLGLPFSVVYSYSNITIRNCLISNSLGAIGGNSALCGSSLTNWLIENSFIGSFSITVNPNCNPVVPVTSGFLVKKTIIASDGGGATNTTFSNCQFGLDAGCAFNRNNQCTFDNCIFFHTSFDQSSENTGNLFHNCLTYQTTFPSASFDLNSWTGGASGSATNCIINQNPLWVTSPLLIIFTTTGTSPSSWDPSFQDGSPAHNNAADGTDIGLTGSLLPYNYHAEPNIPVIRSFQLVNAVVPANGTITIKATATKSQ